MSFYGTSFIFDGVASEEFELMIYDMDSHSQSDNSIGSSVDISDDRVWGKWKPIDYGTSENDPMEFNITFGVMSSDRSLDRYDIAKIAGWLKQPDYKYFTVCQPDMELFRYKVRVTSLSPISVGAMVVALEATMTCDGPYAYMAPIEDTYTITSDTTILYRNRSNINRYYYPKMTIQSKRSSTISIVNQSDGGREFKFVELPDQDLTIEIDCDTQVITSDYDGNIYELCGDVFTFPRLVRGDNSIVVTGACELTIRSEFPFDIGC